MRQFIKPEAQDVKDNWLQNVECSVIPDNNKKSLAAVVFIRNNIFLIIILVNE